jgi:hypothetical protein
MKAMLWLAAAFAVLVVVGASYCVGTIVQDSKDHGQGTELSAVLILGEMRHLTAEIDAFTKDDAPLARELTSNRADLGSLALNTMLSSDPGLLERTQACDVIGKLHASITAFTLKFPAPSNPQVTADIERLHHLCGRLSKN